MREFSHSATVLAYPWCTLMPKAVLCMGLAVSCTIAQKTKWQPHERYIRIFAALCQGVRCCWSLCELMAFHCAASSLMFRASHGTNDSLNTQNKLKLSLTLAIVLMPFLFTCISISINCFPTEQRVKAASSSLSKHHKCGQGKSAYINTLIISSAFLYHPVLYIFKAITQL